MDEEAREVILKGFDALLAAARATHQNGAGGATMCICGANCGGSAACRALDVLRMVLMVAEVPPNHQELLDAARYGLRL